MNVSIWTNYSEATDQADEWAHDTGITYLVIERLPARRLSADLVIDPGLDALLPDAEYGTPHYTILCEAEWAQVSDEWDAEVQYEATPYPEEALQAEYDRSHA